MADSALSLFDEIGNNIDHQSVINELINANPQLQTNIATLKQLYADISKENAIVKIKSKRSNSKLSGLLDFERQKLIINDDTNKDLILQQILDGYHLTSVILQQLGFIDGVKYTFTYIDDDGNFVRAGDMDISLADVRLEAASKGRGYSIRLNAGAIKAKIAAASTSTQVDEIINHHFRMFSQPFYDYQNNNNTGWKINKGVLAEAFERHWENLKHSTEHPEQMQDSDIESVGTRWWMYRMSSGSDPYFTGPDTMYSQVKNANASFIDNLDTVLNTMAAIIRLVDDANSIPDLTAALIKAFNASPQKMNIANKIWEGLDTFAQQQIMKEINATGFAKKGNNIVFTFNA